MSRRLIRPLLHRLCRRKYSTFDQLRLDATCVRHFNAIQLEYVPSCLLKQSENVASKSGNPDFAILYAIMRRSIELLPSFTSGEFVEFLSMFSRNDFVDSALSLAVQAYLPSVIGSFTSNQYPIIFCSLLRLGIDQPVDRMPEDPSSPLVTALVDEIISHHMGEISSQNCLMMLHAIVRRGRSKISPEMIRLAEAISEHPHEWSLPTTIQLVHVLSRVGIENEKSVANLFRLSMHSLNGNVPGANLQQLLSIIYNHSEKHDRTIWEPVLKKVLHSLNRHVVKSMSLPTLAVTLGYLGRLPCDSTVFDSLLNWFLTGANKKSSTTMETLIERILTDPGLDIAHLASILEAAQKFQKKNSHLLAMTVNLALREGVHNIRAVPLCQIIAAVLIDPIESDYTTQAIITNCMHRGIVAPHWSLKSESPVNLQPIVFIEALLRHEQYIRGSPLVIARCVEIRETLMSKKVFLKMEDLPSNIEIFFSTIDKNEVSK